MAHVLPGLGGALGGLRRGSVDVLRPARPGVTDILQTASFALLPFTNRIADGQFTFDGDHYDLPRNFGDHPHTLHGTGWQSAWEVADARDASTLLVLERVASAAWPWAYRAEQRLSLGPDGLHAELTLTNCDDRRMPAGLGFHPYFPRSDTTRLRLQATCVWHSDTQQIPTRPAEPGLFGNWSGGAPAHHEILVDHAYGGWDGRAVITDASGTTRLEATGARAAHLYLPPENEFLCLEPVSHLPNAFNRPDMAFDIVAPGETLSLTMRIAHTAPDVT